jgi:2-amino-4-hydroxy-6-hydroxymethyldihydropteridine diphosphokinase
MAAITTLIVALGSNNNQTNNLERAVSIIKSMFNDAEFSSNMWTNPIGIESDMFLNKLAKFSTKYNLSEILKVLKQVEKDCGNTQNDRDNNIIPMDIDILQYGDKKMHEKDWERPYVRHLMSELYLESHQ